ncbi:MAG TPA: hypothetical protein VHX60_17295 [Acidobacteriaceae bacterium]|jgi:hypothetical protein|nr:hypothetical protein [Acidobacteriaceae bacterium]
MKFSLLERVLWACGFYSTLGLAFVLIVRGRSRTFPVLTAWLLFTTARTILLYTLYQHGAAVWYARVYWGALIPDFAFQVAVVIEIARIVLRPTGTWVRDARRTFAAWGIAGALLAAGLAVWVSPPARTWMAAWQMRSGLFTSLVTCELFVAISMTANRLGLGWRNHVMAVAQGLTVWSSVMVVTSSLRTLLGAQHRGFDLVRACAYFLATFWMSAQLWIAEPERQPLAPQLRNYILALHQRVEYDLRRIDAQP